ncbi:MAG TPA: hypothetical protein VFS16_14030 [Acidimicrobiia bacterium]|nr:hypothetical protein [Acidimicrobiia bacterium]
MAATTLPRLPTLPPDRGLPEAAELLAGGGADRVARFLEARDLEPHRVEAAQAHYRPGRWLAVCYRTSAVERWSGRPVGLTVTAELRAGEPERIWPFPEDPALPGLPEATDAATVARCLRACPDEVALEPIRYRPRRRAVLRYRLVDGTTLFAKVVTPTRARRLRALTAALRTGSGDPPSGVGFALPVGRVASGALVFPGAPGRSLRDLLLAGAPLPAPDRLASLPADIHRRCGPALAGAPELAGLRPRRRFDPVVALAAAQMVARLVPSRAGAAARLAEALITWAEASEAPDEWVVHGDLYENQVLVDGDRLTLIDLDDVGPGDPLLDAANVSAHLLLLATSGAPASSAIGRYRADLRAAFCRALDVDPADLAWREAYCLLRLATGPFRVLHPEWAARTAARLDLAVEAL